MLPRKIKPKFFDVLSNLPGRYVKPAPYNKASGIVAQIYAQVEEEFFINGPTTTHAVCPPLLAGVWMAEREIMLTDDLLTREDKEALGVTFSQVNGCTYCEDLINSTVYGAGETELAEIIRYRKHDEISDQTTRAIHQWILQSYDLDAEILFEPPFSPAEAPEVIGCALMFNYFNRYVKVFFTGTPLKVPFSSKSLKTLLYKMTGLELRESVMRRLKPGRANGFLPAAPLPDELSWAGANANIGDAVARWSAAMEREARDVVPEAVRSRIARIVGDWQGEAMPLSRSWLDPHLDGLGAAETAAMKLALLTALSPGQLSDDIVEAFQAEFDSDKALVVTVAWSAFEAAKQISGWLAEASGYFPGSGQFIKMQTEERGTGTGT